MKLDKKYKVEKVCSPAKDQRPVLQNPHLVIPDDGSGAYVGATDSYRLVMIPVEVEESDTAGVIPLDVVKHSRKGSQTIDLAHEPDNIAAVATSDGLSVPRRGEGKHPDYKQLIPTADPDNAYIAFSAKYLFELAQAMGSDVVRIEFTTPLKPIRVTAKDSDAVGVLMPTVWRD